VSVPLFVLLLSGTNTTWYGNPVVGYQQVYA